MIETATSIAFLMSSLYGAGQANAQAIPVIHTESQTAPIARTLNNSKQVEAYVRKEYANTPILVQIARCESTFRQFDDNGSVIRGKVNKADVGVMQINEKYHSESAIRLGHDIYSIEGNMAYAKYLYDVYGTSPWASSQACWGGIQVLAQK